MKNNLSKKISDTSQEIQKKIVFDGKNAKEIKDFLSTHYDCRQEINGRLFINLGHEQITIFKGDAVALENGKPQFFSLRSTKIKL